MKAHLENCIVVNQTVQHFLPEVIGFLQNEIKRFSNYAVMHLYIHNLFIQLSLFF